MAVGYNHFPLIASRIRPACKRVVRETAKDIQDMAVINAPVDTGWLVSSIYVATTSGVKYSGAKFTGTGYQLLSKEMFPPEMPDDELTAIVGVGATYGIYVEMGTRFMGAQPYFYPAVEWARANFMRALDFEGLLASGVTGSIGIEAV
jgi:Bacteriophage HK97-gp10, putative tail-component